MNALHKIGISFLAGLLLVGGAFAQDSTTQAPPAPAPQGSAPMHRHMRRDPVAMHMLMMSKKLNLTEDQRAKIQPIVQNQMQQMRAVRQDTSLTPEQRKEKMQQFRQNMHEQIKPLLTPEQVAKLGTGPGKGPDGAHGNPLEMMSKHLSLTDDQKAKLEPLFADQQKQVQAVKQDASLTPEQKRAKVQEIRKATHQQVMTVLTPEQQNQLKQMRGKGMHGRGHGGPGAPAPSAQQAPPQGA